MAGNEALGLGYGGVTMVRRPCGLSRKAIAKGIRELQEGPFSQRGAYVGRERGAKRSPRSMKVC